MRWLAWLPDRLNPRRSLRARFALVLGGSGLVFALLLAAVVDRYQRAQLVDSLGQAMRREALLQSRSLNLALQERLQQLRQAAAEPLLASGLMEPGDVRLLLEALRAQQPELAWLAVADAQGQVLVASNALRVGERLDAEPWWAEASQGPFIGQRRPAGALERHLGLAADGHATDLIDLGTPLIDFQGGRRGALVACLRMDWLEALHQSLLAPDRRLPGSDSWVLDREHRVLIGPPGRLGQALQLPGLAALPAGEPPGLLSWGPDGDFVTAVGHDPSPAAPGAGLTVVLRQPAALAFEAADVLRRQLLWLAAGATGLFLLISLWLAGRIAQPVRALSAAAARVGQGEAPDFAPGGGLPAGRDHQVADQAPTLQTLHLALAQRLAAQQQASERFETLFNGAPVPIFLALNHRLLMANEACLALFGATDVAQLLDKAGPELIHPEDRALLDARNTELLGWQPGRVPPPLAHRICRLDGTVRQVESTAVPLRMGPWQGVQVAMRDVTEQREAQRQLREREAQLAHTSHMARVGGWAIDLATREVRWTDELAQIFDLPPGQMPSGEMMFEHCVGEHRERLRLAFRAALRDGLPYDLELQLRMPNGQLKWVRTQSRVLRQGGRTVQLEGIAQDITDRRAAEEAVRALNAELEQRVAERTAQLQAANAELDSFAYAVSHDLRSPLRAMSGFAQVLVEDVGPQLDAEALGHLGQITQASQRMGGLIDGLLVLSRSTRGEMQWGPVDLSALAAQAVAELQRNEPDRRVQVHIQPGLQAEGDRRMLDAVMHNLIGNAWKYTGRTATPRIEVLAQQIDGERWYVVTDNGDGFDMAHAGQLFKAFARLHRQDEYPGLGIGLATVQRIVRRHGGQIQAQARRGQGASFRFTLPPRRAAEPAEAPRP